MRHLFLTAAIGFISLSIKAQTAETIIGELQFTNKEVTNKSCLCQCNNIISNRAMNIFLADKTAYLSENGDLSFFTNYVTLHTASGTLTINHNFQKAKGIDEPIKSLFSVGVKANVADGFNATFLDKKFKNQLGITINQTWLGKVKTRVEGCTKNDLNAIATNQKQAMNVLRAGILHLLEIEINKKEADFNLSLTNLDSASEIPEQNMEAAKALIRKNFYEDLAEEYQEKFARLQAETLTKTFFFKLVSTHWTSLIAYVPLAFPKFNVASSLSSPFNQKHPYPFDVTLSHTRLWESSKTGRLFITLSGRILLNNSTQSFSINKTNLTEYKNLGGTDTVHLASLKNDEVYVGDYKTFITPSIRARVVYFPSDSHVGISFLLEQNFGSYNLLNARLGIPVILINSKKTPAMNIEFQVAFFDMTHQISSARKLGNKTSIGVGVGIPFSRLMY